MTTPAQRELLAVLVDLETAARRLHRVAWPGDMVVADLALAVLEACAAHIARVESPRGGE